MTAAAISPSKTAPSARSASEDIPESFAPHPIARPWAAAMATLMPVKLPGPTPTRMAEGTLPSSSSEIIGTSRSECPRPMSSSRDSRHRPSSASKAAEQAALDVSKARITGGIVVTCASTPQVGELHRLDRFHFGNIVANEALDPTLQSDGRGWAAGAGAMHREKQPTVLIAPVSDVAAVL